MLAEKTAPGEPSYAAAFAAGLLDPSRKTPALLSDGTSDAALTSRYNVYRNNVTVSLIEALAATFPAVQRMTGPDFFRAMARSYVRRHPPTSPLLFEYGRDFPAFIEAYDYARPAPWLADVARIERAWLDAYHAADAVVLKPSVLTSFPPDKLADLALTPHPATRLVRSSHPAVTLFCAYRSEPQDSDRTEASEPEDALITRPNLEVVVRHLPLGHATFIEALMSKGSLGEAAAAALTASDDFDLAIALAGLLQAGVFCEAYIGGHSCSP